MAAMATSSLSSVLLAASNSSSLSSRPQLSFPSSAPSKLLSARPSRLSSSRRSLAVPEVLESSVGSATNEDDAPTAKISVGETSDMAVPKHRIRIKLRSYWVPLIEDSCKKIMDAARTTNTKTMGPIPLPTKKRVYCVLKSPHVHKDARFHFEIRTHQRLIDILYPTAQTIDCLMQLDLPAGVDVEVKL
ncbi:30S ribosomal protein S10- chloroplastic [Striga hermonthica]|uniref:Small ribosomal subunit protein uS10c n=1 Tax=Striga hermonthica TaxID=68872 RepID=A0A9N7NFR0_STRHE|nr:30S ribosomal protein S10- chloroplastic [Striga hermonthica]